MVWYYPPNIVQSREISLVLLSITLRTRTSPGSGTMNQSEAACQEMADISEHLIIVLALHEELDNLRFQIGKKPVWSLWFTNYKKWFERFLVSTTM